MIFSFAYLLCILATAISSVLFLEKRLGTRHYIHTILRFFYFSPIFEDFKVVRQLEYSNFYPRYQLPIYLLQTKPIKMYIFLMDCRAYNAPILLHSFAHSDDGKYQPRRFFCTKCWKKLFSLDFIHTRHFGGVIKRQWKNFLNTTYFFINNFVLVGLKPRWILS